MFRKECQKCLHLESEVNYLRDQVKRLTDRVIALAAPSVYDRIDSAPNPSASYFGDGKGDQYKVYDEYGQAFLVEQDLELK
jgi:hypothetical protein